jgi:hypothetical protein
MVLVMLTLQLLNVADGEFSMLSLHSIVFALHGCSV